MQQRYLTQPWHEVAEFYRALAKHDGREIEPLVQFVHYIEASPYSRSLFGATSHDELHIGRVANFAAHDNELSVKFDQNKREFHFTFTQRADEREPWSISCGEADGPQTFQRLLHKRLRWFHEG